MKKYYIPMIKITSFLLENVVTESGGPQQQYIGEVNTLMGNMPQEKYMVRVESVANILSFETE